MPATQEHQQKAGHNNTFWSGLDLQNTPYLDWAVTVMFYEAVHWIEAFLARKNLHSSGHPDRERSMSKMSELRSDSYLITDYKLLRTESENARYLCYSHTAEQVTDDLVPAITRVRETVQRLLS